MSAWPGAGAATVVVVEGVSDRVAVETLAARRERDLDAEGVVVIPIGGAQALGNVLALIRAEMGDVKVAGLCDAGEEADFRRALERGGLGTGLTRAGMEELGFFVCVQDLEDELIRALGADRVEEVISAQGNLGSLRTFRKQPQWRERPSEEQLRRFLGTTSGRKIEYARLLVEALDLERVPRPLERLLAAI